MVKIGTILAIFELFEILLFGKISTKNSKKIDMPHFGEFSRSSRDLYRNLLQIELSLGRLSKFFEKWWVHILGILGCSDMMLIR